MLKNFIKKIIKKIGEESVEVAKDSVSQLGKTISPAEMIKQATGTQKNEFSQYLQNLDGSQLSPEDLEKRKKEMAEKDEDEAKKLRTFLQSTAPHLRPTQQPSSLRPYEVTIQDMEKKKAQETESQKQQPLVSPSSKQAPGMLGGKKKKPTGGFEMGKDKKSG